MHNQNNARRPNIFTSDKVYFLVIGIVAVIMAIYFLWPLKGISADPFSQCLKQKQLTMYGSDTCSNCINQKHILGEYLKDIQYVNCDFYYDLCQTRGIRVYPVWHIGDRYVKGVQSLPTLGEFAGCKYKNK